MYWQHVFKQLADKQKYLVPPPPGLSWRYPDKLAQPDILKEFSGHWVLPVHVRDVTVIVLKKKRKKKKKKWIISLFIMEIDIEPSDKQKEIMSVGLVRLHITSKLYVIHKPSGCVCSGESDYKIWKFVLTE